MFMRVLLGISGRTSNRRTVDRANWNGIGGTSFAAEEQHGGAPDGSSPLHSAAEEHPGHPIEIAPHLRGQVRGYGGGGGI